MKFTSAFKAWREANKLSYRDAAKIVGVSHSVLYRFEAHHEISGQNLARIIAWLFEDETKPKHTK